MHDMAAHCDGRGPFSSLHLLRCLERQGGNGAALDRRRALQNARWRHGDGGWRLCYQNTGWGRQRLRNKRRLGRLP